MEREPNALCVEKGAQRKEFLDALADVFQFYSAQLQSHAATAASLALVLLGILTLKPVGTVQTVLWLLGTTTLATGVSFSLLRLFVYGVYSGAVLWSTWDDVQDSAKSVELQWERMLPHTQAG